MAVAAFATVPAWADTAVVPTDFATVQAAVTAVEGTTGALVRIDSDATFTETVTISLSLAIEAGPEFAPTLQGTLVGCDFGGGCALNFNPTDAAPTSFVVRGLTFIPASGSGSGHRMIQLFNEGAGTATLLAERLRIRDPGDSGAGAFQSRIGLPGTGDNAVTFRDISLQLGGEPEFSTTAFEIQEHGSLTLERIDLLMTGSSALGFVARGDGGESVFALRDSTFDIEGQIDFSSNIGFIGSSVRATIERNVFRMRGPVAPGTAGGIRMDTRSGIAESQSLVLDANQFVGLGGSLGDALSVAPQPEDASEVLLTNNVIRSMGGGFSFRPQSSTLGATLSATLVGNTIDGSAGDAIAIDAQDHTESSIAIYNNLLTRNGGHGIAYAESGGIAIATIAHNGFSFNVAGDVEAPLVASASVVGDPSYAGDDDLRLREGSPMLDAGTNGAPGLTALDAAQRPRIQNGMVDIGAFEGGVSPPIVEVPTLGGVGLGVLAVLLAVGGLWRSSARGSPRTGAWSGRRGWTLLVACALPAVVEAQLPGVGLSSVRAQKFGDEVPPPYAAAGFDLFASALVAGDWNGDGADDLATGIPSNDCALDFTLPGCGAVVVRYGIRGRGLDAIGATTFLTQQQAGSPDPALLGEGFGSALAACDFNGDQIDDLAVGIPFNRVGNFRQGAVAIYLGANGGLPLVAVQVLRQGSAGVPGVGENDDRFGQALSCGDFDADGKADLAIGVPRKVVTAHAFAGQVVVLHGATGGLTATGAIALDQDTTGMLDAAEAGDTFGWALASGDIDGDGFDDLAIGVPGETDNVAQPQKGAIQVLFGTAAGLTPAGNEFFTAYLIDSTPQMNYNFGRALASGDFDRDGFADLAIGVPYAGASPPSAGLVGEAFGSAGGIETERWGYFDQQDIYNAPDEPNDYFGYTLAAGDFDGDGTTDLAIGHPGESLLAASEGAATVLMGVSGSGLQVTRYRGFAAGYDGVPGPANQPDRSFSLALAAGDFDGDGADDLVLGAPYEDDDGLTDAGVETVLYGALFADGFESVSSAYWSATAP